MTKIIDIDNLRCYCSVAESRTDVAYILYPIDILGDWIELAAEKHDVSIVVITGMEWQDVLSPWPAKGVPKGCPDFKGEAPEFLALLQNKVIPQVEAAMGLVSEPRRTLVGVSMSGLFAMWQWMVCDTFADIASLSGSFWYDGFTDWMKAHAKPKGGKAFFLLGDKEANSSVKAFNSVAANTREIIALLRAKGIPTEFVSVPGNHYADPIPRLARAFAALFPAPAEP